MLCRAFYGKMYFSLFLVLLLAVGHKALHVHSPSSASVAQLGDTVLLPCFSQSPLPLEGLQVEWRKADSESLVILFQQGEVRPDHQSQPFRDRVHLFPDEISKGNFSILLNNVVRNDTGVYRCKVSTTQESSETEVELKDIEPLVVKGADHAVFASVGEDVILNCSVDSNVPPNKIEEVSWRRTIQDQDILILFFQDNEVHSDSSHESYQERAEFFVSEIPKGNFSLKLKDVKIEDKGEFICEVHMGNLSAHTVVVLQRLGFSIFHMLILVLCFTALLLSAGLCAHIFILLRQKVSSGKTMKMHASLILCPNICMCVAFILWSKEGSLIEIVMCSAVSIIRPLMLIKTAPYTDRFPKRLVKTVKVLALPVSYSVITTAACSTLLKNARWAQTASQYVNFMLAGLAVLCFIIAVILAGFALRMHSAMALEICSGALLGLFLSNSTYRFDKGLHVPAIFPPVIMAILMLNTLQRHGFQRKPFKCVHITLSSVVVIVSSLIEISVFILLVVALKNFNRTWFLPFEVVLQVTAWLSVILLIRYKCFTQGCCSHQRGIGYVCCAVILAVLVTAYGALCVHYVHEYMDNNKGRGDIPHILIYMFGAVGLNVVNSITLMTELSLKAGQGERTVEDLRVIVLPFETIFVFGWLALQVCDVWIRTRHRIKENFEDKREQTPQDFQEMDVLASPMLKPSESFVVTA
ncbi:hypothetical protein SRHO_G00035920 [Serrasalmus rhombeus]